MRGEGFEVKVEAATGRYVYCVMGVAKEGKLQVAARLEFKRSFVFLRTQRYTYFLDLG